MDKAEEAIFGQGGYLLTNEQKKRLILAARNAYETQHYLGLTDDPFDVWRKGALWDAVQVGSFREVRQRQYNAALKHFLALAGRRAAAERVRKPDDDKKVRAMWALNKETAALAGAFGGSGGATLYAATLFKRIHRTTPELATAKQVWSVLFTMRNRAKKKMSDVRSQMSDVGANNYSPSQGGNDVRSTTAYALL